jgi:hypothetical protein
MPQDRILNVDVSSSRLITCCGALSMDSASKRHLSCEHRHHGTTASHYVNIKGLAHFLRAQEALGID